MEALQISIGLFSNPIPPREISRRLGVMPYTELLEGESNKKLNIPRQNLWTIRSDASLADVGEQWNDLVARFGEKWDDFIEISKQGTVRITIIVDATDRLPPVIIPPEMSKAAYLLNSELSVSYYDYKEPKAIVYSDPRQETGVLQPLGINKNGQ